MNLCSFGLHKWPKWSEPKDLSITLHNKTRDTIKHIAVMSQDRFCERCGMYVTRKVEPPELKYTPYKDS